MLHNQVVRLSTSYPNDAVHLALVQVSAFVVPLWLQNVPNDEILGYSPFCLRSVAAGKQVEYKAAAAQPECMMSCLIQRIARIVRASHDERFPPLVVQRRVSCRYRAIAFTIVLDGMHRFQLLIQNAQGRRRLSLGG
ncbi:hypothetical protein D9M68_559320 [compost metagenome]